LSPGNDGALFNLAVLYANHNMEDEVRSTLQQLLQVPLCFAAACILVLLMRFMQVNPDHAGAHAMLSRFSF
jgi:hypothetical protein